MKTIDELAIELKLTSDQTQGIKKYFEDSVIELLTSLQQDNHQSFEETINSIRHADN